jgi:hypothetical protein
MEVELRAAEAAATVVSGSGRGCHLGSLWLLTCHLLRRGGCGFERQVSVGPFSATTKSCLRQQSLRAVNPQRTREGRLLVACNRGMAARREKRPGSARPVCASVHLEQRPTGAFRAADILISSTSAAADGSSQGGVAGSWQNGRYCICRSVACAAAASIHHCRRWMCWRRPLTRMEVTRMAGATLTAGMDVPDAVSSLGRSVLELIRLQDAASAALLRRRICRQQCRLTGSMPLYGHEAVEEASAPRRRGGSCCLKGSVD